MYRAERVLRKQLQTEGTEMPAMGGGVAEGGNAEEGAENGEKFVVGGNWG